MFRHPKSSRVFAGGTIPPAFSFYRPIDEQIVNAPKLWGGPARERTGPVPYRRFMMILTFMITITTVIIWRVRCSYIPNPPERPPAGPSRRCFLFTAQLMNKSSVRQNNLNRCDEVFDHRDQIMTSNNAIPV